MTIDGCVGSNNEIRFLEHVHATISLHYSRRGDLQITLVSPSGTRSTLLSPRKNDYEDQKLRDWPFMSVFFWGENPEGEWRLMIENSGSALNFGEWRLMIEKSGSALNFGEWRLMIEKSGSALNFGEWRLMIEKSGSALNFGEWRLMIENTGSALNFG